jgi:hypothetical protein
MRRCRRRLRALSGYGQADAGHDQARVRRRLRNLRQAHRRMESLTGTEQTVASLVAEGSKNG